MTGKLCKYEFKTSIRQISIAWMALLASSVLLAVIIASSHSLIYSSTRAVASILTGVLSTLYGVILTAMVVMAVLIVVVRFYNSVCSDEGYLIHTLPVSIRSIIVSKGLVATALLIVSLFVAMISICFILMGISVSDFFESCGCVFEEIGREPRILLLVFEGVVVLILGIMKSVYNVYAAIALGQMANKHRILMSIVSYIGISVVLTAIVSTVLNVTSSDLIREPLFETGRNFAAYFGGWGIGQAVIIAVIVVELVQLIIFHAITEVALTKRLNLL